MPFPRCGLWVMTHAGDYYMNPQAELPGERENVGKSYIQYSSSSSSFFFFLHKSSKTVRFDISFLKLKNYFGDFSGSPSVKTAFQWSRS